MRLESLRFNKIFISFTFSKYLCFGKSLTNSLLSFPQIMGIKTHFLYTSSVVSSKETCIKCFLRTFIVRWNFGNP